ARRRRDWDVEAFQPLASAGEFAQSCCCLGLLLLMSACFSQAVGCCVLWRYWKASSLSAEHPAVAASPGALVAGVRHRRIPLGPRLVKRVSALLYLGSAIAPLTAATCYTAASHHRLKLLVSEFLFATTDGAVTVWPEDLDFRLAGGSFLAVASGLVSLLGGLVLLCTELDGILVRPNRVIQITDHSKQQQNNNKTTSELEHA
ncbi:unnamed protein product, partial [Polarella glacialis]